MTARIFRPTRSATQSGAGRTKRWHLVYSPERPRGADPLMGWTSSDDMKSQIRLSFDTKEQAVEYAERNGIAFVVEERGDLLVAAKGPGLLVRLEQAAARPVQGAPK